MRIVWFGRNPKTAEPERILSITRENGELVSEKGPRANDEMVKDFLGEIDNSSEESCEASMKALEIKYSGGYFWARFEP